MTSAIASPSAAQYLAPLLDAAAASNADASSDTVAPNSVTSPSAPPSAQPLAPSTVAALVAQQASSSGGSSDPAPPPGQFAISASVIANMQSFATTSPTQYTDQINSYAATLADNSTASDAEKLQAWTNLNQMLSSGEIYSAGNVADLQNAYSAVNGKFAQQVYDVEDQFKSTMTQLSAPAMAAGELGNGYQAQLDALNQFSSSDQQILLATMSASGSPQGYSSLAGLQAYATVDDWKAALQQEAADFSAKYPSAVDPVSPSSTATSGAVATAMAGTTTEPPAALNGTASAVTTSSDVALQLLTEAADRTTTEQSRSSTGTSAKAASHTGNPSKSHNPNAEDSAATTSSAA